MKDCWIKFSQEQPEEDIIECLVFRRIDGGIGHIFQAVYDSINNEWVTNLHFDGKNKITSRQLVRENDLWSIILWPWSAP